jgi:hypothetical protein
MSDLDRSDAHRAAEYLELAHDGETSGSTDQGEGGPTAADDQSHLPAVQPEDDQQDATS